MSIVPTGRLTGVVPSAPDERDHLYTPGIKYSDLKQIHSNAQFLQDAEDQQQVGSCVTHGVTTAIEAHLNAHGLASDYSRYALYQMTLAAEGRLGQEGGLFTRDAFQVGRHYGLAPEADAPYVNAEPTSDASADIYALAQDHTIGQYQLIHPPQIDGINSDALSTKNKLRAACQEGLFPVVACVVSEDIRHMTGPWQTQSYRGPSPAVPDIGGHLMTMFGFDMTVNKALLRNWWKQADGSWWGDNGWGGFDLDELVNSPFFESYVIRDFNHFGDNYANPVQPGFHFYRQNKYYCHIELVMPNEVVGQPIDIYIGSVNGLSAKVKEPLFSTSPRGIWEPTRPLSPNDMMGNNTAYQGGYDECWSPFAGTMLPTLSNYICKRSQRVKVFDWKWLPDLSGTQIYATWALHGQAPAEGSIQHVCTIPNY